ncbi:MAG TPA: hypothetical protein VFL80_02800 [Thermoanaerobaculia bacterium]|nr:hypothetical protein [Thermoanaerobaculia bacterium]
MSVHRLLGSAAAVLILLGCQEQPVESSRMSVTPIGQKSALMQLVSSSIAVGERAVVRFPQPLDAAGDRYWITMIEAGQADSQWGAWQYVDKTTREVTLAVSTTPGSYEVRLHDGYPTMPYHVVARLPLTVTGSTASSRSAGMTSAPERTAVTAVPTPEPMSAVTVPAADVAAMAATEFGSPSTRFEAALPVRRWAQDGGGTEIITPSAGHRFLVVEFPHAGTQTGQIFYDSRQVFLHVGGHSLKPYAATTGGASAPAMSRTTDGRRVFQREVYASHYAPAHDLPFALAFQIPESARGGTLKLGSRESALSW